MTSVDSELDSRGVAGHLTEMPFSAIDLSDEIIRKLKRDRYAWLTTVAPTGVPVPMLTWFCFDGATFTLYSPARAGRVVHVIERPEVSLHLESDGIGGGIVAVGGRAAVTAEGVDPRDDREFWAKYHVEADLVGLSEAISSHSVRITVTPTTLLTTLVT
jgi:PPOX class probable F420-dependent enzyme